MTNATINDQGVGVNQNYEEADKKKTPKLSELIKTGIARADRDFYSEDFDVDGKTVVRYTLDFERITDGAEEIVEVKDGAKWYKGNETIQITVPMPCIAALKLDKKYASRRWLSTDLSDEEKAVAGVIRGKGAFMALSLEMAKLKTKAYNKAKAFKHGLSKSTGNTGLVGLNSDYDTFLAKVSEFTEDVSAYFTGATEEKIVEDF